MTEMGELPGLVAKWRAEAVRRSFMSGSQIFEACADELEAALSRGEGRAVACYRVHDQFGADRWYDGLPTKAVLQNVRREQSRIEYAYTHPAQEQGAAVDGESFICYLIDNCERETISEESLHSWLAAFLKNPRYHNPAALAQTGENGRE